MAHRVLMHCQSHEEKEDFNSDGHTVHQVPPVQACKQHPSLEACSAFLDLQMALHSPWLEYKKQ